MVDRNDEYLPCSVPGCTNKSIAKAGETNKEQWGSVKCVAHQKTDYGQNFINWIANRISSSTSGDSSGRFVLRELVQNADDVEADLLVLEFTKEALLVYNNGDPFNLSEDPKKNDFDRISNVLARPKEEEFEKSGNFGSGFQTVYLFTNYPEVHSHGMSYRFDPITRIRRPLGLNEKIQSPYWMSERKKGAVFKLPWRTEANAVVETEGGRFFESEEPWKRWEKEERRRLYEELKEYAHDSILCCQHLRKIRLLWMDGKEEAYQAERDFGLSYLDMDGRIGKVIEGEGIGGYLPDRWSYDSRTEYRYMIGSDFVRSSECETPCLVVKTPKGGFELKTYPLSTFQTWRKDRESYSNFLRSNRAQKKSDLHILIPLYPWATRIKGRSRKSWSYSVIPLPMESGNNFSITAHLFPREARETLELHQEEAKRLWLKNVLFSAAILYVRTYHNFVEHVITKERMDDAKKQEILLDYLPHHNLPTWFGVNIADSEALDDGQIDVFGHVFSQRILLSSGHWYGLFDYDEDSDGEDAYSERVDLPRDKEERSLVEKMGYITFSNEFLEHPRFRELKAYKERLESLILMDDGQFIADYGDKASFEEGADSFYSENCDEDGMLRYGKDPIDIQFVAKLIEHCLGHHDSEAMRGLPIIPNRRGEMCSANDLRIDDKLGPSIMASVIPDRLYPHPDVVESVRKFVPLLDDPVQLTEGMLEKRGIVEKDRKLIGAVFDWLDECKLDLAPMIRDTCLAPNSDSMLVPLKELHWTPLEHHDTLLALSDRDERKSLVSKDLLKAHEHLIIDRLRMDMFNYPDFLIKHQGIIDGPSNAKMQKVLIEGLLRGLDLKKWSVDDLSDLKMLPVEGKLREPGTACLGSTKDSSLDQFLGCVDQPIQNIVLATRGSRAALAKLGCGDLDLDFVECYAKASDRFSKANNRDGKRGLSRDDLAMISKLLSIAMVKGDKNLRTKMEGRDTLPMKFKGRVILGSPPQWGTGKPRIEKYEREWPWTDQTGMFPKGLTQIIEGVRRFSLDEGYKDTEKAIIEKFNIENLLSNDETPRGLVMLFLLPKDEPSASLFSMEGLKQHLGRDVSEIEANELKKILIEYLRRYYSKGKHAGEQISIDDKECLYDDKGVWRAPKDFSLNIDSRLGATDLYQLHQDFSEANGWTKDVLTNMGVLQTIDFSRLERMIKKKATEGRSKANDPVLLSIIMMGLRDRSWTRDDWRKVSEVAWVPTKDGQMKRPKTALVLTKDMVKALGDADLPDLVDDSTVGDDLTMSIEISNLEDLARVGLRYEPTLAEMLKAWRQFMEKGTPPPEAFFDRLESSYLKIADELATVNPDSFLYYMDGQWLNPRSVVSGSSKDIPQTLGSSFHFTDSHPRLLRWLRREMNRHGPPTISCFDVLEKLASNPSHEGHALTWSYVVGRRKDLGDDERRSFKDMRIIDIGGTMFSPSRIIIASRGSEGLSYEGTIGDWVSLRRERVVGELDALKILGAWELRDLLVEEELRDDLLYSMAREIENGNKPLLKDLTTIFGELIRSRERLDKDLEVIPVLKDEEVLCVPCCQVVLQDEDGIWKLFEDGDGLFLFRSDWNHGLDSLGTGLTDWLESCGAVRIEKIIQRSEEPDTTTAIRDQDLTDLLHRRAESVAQNSVGKFTDSDYHQIASNLNDLGESTVYLCGTIRRKYVVKVPRGPREWEGDALISRNEDLKVFYDRRRKALFIRSNILDKDRAIQLLLTNELPPSFRDRTVISLWEAIIQLTFSARERPAAPMRSAPDLDDNLNLLDDWWRGEIPFLENDLETVLEGDFWWKALGYDLAEGREERVRFLKEGLFEDRQLMFGLFSAATLLSEFTHRTSVKKFIDHFQSIGLDFSEIYKIREIDVVTRTIEDALRVVTSETSDGVHPRLRSRMMDIIIIKRALGDETMGGAIIDMLRAHMEAGDSPEQFLVTGRGYSVRPFMNGFKGMFTGQIYFMVREAYRLGVSPRWGPIAFHAPRQVRELLDNIGYDLPSESEPLWREKLAKQMVKKIETRGSLKDWQDIPFFEYYDQFCSRCKRRGVPTGCILDCYRKSEGWGDH